jgi:hypothetical protein
VAAADLFRVRLSGYLAAAFFARNSAHRFLVASAMRFRPAPLILRFFGADCLAALTAAQYHSIHKNDLARAMVSQSEQAYLAIAHANAPKEATVKILEYKEMQPFFVKGESDEP